MADPNTPTESGWYWFKTRTWEVVHVCKTIYHPDCTGLALHAMDGIKVVVIPLEEIQGDDRWGPRVLPPEGD